MDWNPFAVVCEILAFIFPASECGMVFILYLMERLKIIILNEKWFHNLRAVWSEYLGLFFRIMKIFAILDGPTFENLGFSVSVGKIGSSFTECKILQNFFFQKIQNIILKFFFWKFFSIDVLNALISVNLKTMRTVLMWAIKSAK